MAGALLTIPLSVVLKFLPVWTSGMFPTIPFLDRMTITFLAVAFTMIVISQFFNKRAIPPNVLIVDTTQFSISRGFLVGSILIFGILAALYTVFW